jgi:hypothetical protein
MTVFEFKLAKVPEIELSSIKEASQPTGEYKTLYAVAETEEIAFQRVDYYVSKTKYADIEDKKFIR